MKYIKRFNENMISYKDNKDVIKKTINDILLEITDIGFYCNFEQLVKWVDMDPILMNHLFISKTDTTYDWYYRQEPVYHYGYIAPMLKYILFNVNDIIPTVNRINRYLSMCGRYIGEFKYQLNLNISPHMLFVKKLPKDMMIESLVINFEIKK